MSEEDTDNRTIAVPAESVRQLEQEFPGLLNFQERVRYCVQYTLKEHESQLSRAEIEDIREILEELVAERDGD